MTLIKSISGIRGTIGGKPGDALTPVDIVLFSASYASWLKETGATGPVVIGRDARISGPMVSDITCSTIRSLGFDVIDLGLSTTPTVEVAVPDFNAAGGIIVTASHNPGNWNALKLLNNKGEFISADDGARILKLATSQELIFEPVEKLGSYKKIEGGYISEHIDQIIKLPLVDKEAIKKAEFHIAVDAVNSTGGIAVPLLLEKLGVKNIKKMFCEPNGKFPHNPEPLKENLTELSNEVKNGDANFGIVVDPDVDRLAFVMEDGEMFGEEYTLVAVADYILSQQKGNTVSNLSSTRALRDVTEQHGGSYAASAVGEVNVVAKMKEVKAVIGGEGNGGIIYPELHYGRDALVGIALFLTYVAKTGKTVKELKESYPQYHISKNKIELTPKIDVDKILEEMKVKYAQYPVNSIDGVKIEFENEWVHLRRSNTEPIIRIYTESSSLADAEELALKIITEIKNIVSSTLA